MCRAKENKPPVKHFPLFLGSSLNTFRCRSEVASTKMPTRYTARPTDSLVGMAVLESASATAADAKVQVSRREFSELKVVFRMLTGTERPGGMGSSEQKRCQYICLTEEPVAMTNRINWWFDRPNRSMKPIPVLDAGISSRDTVCRPSLCSRLEPRPLASKVYWRNGSRPRRMSQRDVPTGDDSRLPRSMRSPFAGLMRSDEDMVARNNRSNLKMKLQVSIYLTLR